MAILFISTCSLSFVDSLGVLVLGREEAILLQETQAFRRLLYLE